MPSNKQQQRTNNLDEVEGGRAKTILVVDDEQPILDLLSDVLRDEGYTVFTARTGVEALRIAQSTPVSLVLTDLMMPQLDGRGLLVALREDARTANVPVLLMTAINFPKDAQFNALIRKPFDLGDMLEVIDQHLGQ